MVDSFTEVTSESWFSRIIGSIKSVVVGLAFFVVSFPILFWNEGRAVQTAKSLEEGAGAVVSVSADRVDGGNEGKLVHMSGTTATESTLTDEEFGVSEKAIKLVRTVEMYQWKEESKSETKEKLGGGTETVTTYDYKKEWSSSLIDSGSFKRPGGHENPGQMPAEDKTFVAPKVTLGAFTLSEAQVGQIDKAADRRVDDAALTAANENWDNRLKVENGRFYLGANPASPAIGDTRISFKVVKTGPVSIVGRQVRDTFEPYQAKAGDAILLLKEETLSAAAMFQAAQDENTMLTWILRGVGFFLMFFGLLMIFNPIAVFADVIPLVGTLLGAGIAIFAGAIAAALSVSTIAVAWIFYRPLLGIGLFVLAAGAMAGLVYLGIKKKRERAAAAPLAA